MGTTAGKLPDDVDALKALVLEQYQALHERDAHIAYLREQLNLAIAKRFAPSSEKAPADQLGLFNEAEAETDAPAPEAPADEAVTVPAHARKTPGRRRLPDELPRVDIVHDVPDAEKQCPCGCGEMALIGEDVSEQLDIIPAKVQVLRHVRPRYACPRCQAGGVAQAPMPPQPIPKSLASPGLLAYVATAKYVDALPLYRQHALLGRAGIELSRTTLASWMVACGALVQPLINLLRDTLLGYDVLQMDETTVQVLKEPGRSAQSQSYLWVQRGGPPGRSVILYDYDPSRSSAVPQRLLAGYQGYLQTDGYAVYNAVARVSGITAVGCFAHARRKFDEAIRAQGQGAKARTGKAHQGLAFIQKLYRIERAWKDAAPEDRHAARQAEARPVIQELKAWLDKSLPQVPEKSATGTALGYLAHQWPGLIRYLEDGRLAIDNNHCENAIRPFVIGRKNWLFSNTPKGANASANLYALIETAKANGLEPYAYLRHVFAELPKATTVEAFEALLPWNVTL